MHVHSKARHCIEMLKQLSNLSQKGRTRKNSNGVNLDVRKTWGVEEKIVGTREKRNPTSPENSMMKKNRSSDVSPVSPDTILPPLESSSVSLVEVEREGNNRHLPTALLVEEDVISVKNNQTPPGLARHVTDSRARGGVFQ